MRNTPYLATAVATLISLISTAAVAIAPQDRVENFRLMDNHGDSHELYYYDDMKAVVVMVQGNGCPIVRNAMPRFQELKNEYAEQGVLFFLLNSNLLDIGQRVSRDGDEYG